MRLQTELARHFNVWIDDRDLNEARDCLTAVDGSFPSKKGTHQSEKAPVRIATIDNYQGEEANIVIVSLVRSNPEGLIGFLKEAERVNVMLSRARNCQIIIGNRKTLERAKGSSDPLKGGNPWRKILSSLEDSGSMFQGLPRKCQIHGTEAFLANPADFHVHCPDGGCKEACHNILDCGHPCKKRCHIGKCMECDVLLQDKCPRGHSLMKKCSEDPPKCMHTISWRCPMNHHVSGPCNAGKFNMQCKICVQLERDEKDKLVKEEALNKELEQKSRNLEALKGQLEEAERSQGHKEELARIEAELALAEKELLLGSPGATQL